MLRYGLCALLLLLLTACEGGGHSVLPVVAADPTSPYANQLAPCARQSGEQRSCRLADLPMLGMQSNRPDKALVMQRVATTDAWMAQRFSELLERLPADILLLMRSVTAVIIGADVRPSFYWRQTGAIYLDPANLWLSVEEKRSIDPAPDYRAGFGAQLNFEIISRYVLNNDYAWYGYALNDESVRNLDDIVLPMARLLYHELAHAGDFFPTAELDALDRQQTIAQAANRLESSQRQLSQRLQATHALQSQQLFELAEVSFTGRDPSAAELALDAPAIAAEFSPDGSNDDYAYVSRFEDLAMLFEETMMAKNFAVERDVAVTPRPATGEAHIVQWGQRRRITDSAVQPRAQQVASGLLPSIDFAAFFAVYGPPQDLRQGASWNDNLDPAGSGKRVFRPALGITQPQQLPRDEVR